jgi:hypothetical protein
MEGVVYAWKIYGKYEEKLKRRKRERGVEGGGRRRLSSSIV